MQYTLIDRTLLQQLLLKLRVRDDALLDEQLCDRVCHRQGGDQEFFQ